MLNFFFKIITQHILFIILYILKGINYYSKPKRLPIITAPDEETVLIFQYSNPVIIHMYNSYMSLLHKYNFGFCFLSTCKHFYHFHSYHF